MIKADLDFAAQWRIGTRSIDLEAMKRSLPPIPFKASSLDEVVAFADEMLALPEVQAKMLTWLLTFLQLEEYVCEWVRHRWKVHKPRSIAEFAPYAFHCLRVNVIFFVSMSFGVVGTRPTNVLDVEYLCYAPFAHIFCSGDKLHSQLAPYVLERDQSFVGRDAMRDSLSTVAAARTNAAETEPDPQSLIVQLWQTHLGMFHPQASSEPISKERSDEIMKELKPMMDAIRRARAEEGQNPHWP